MLSIPFSTLNVNAYKTNTTPKLSKQAMKTMSFINEHCCTQNHNLMMCFHPMHWALKEINNIFTPNNYYHTSTIS